MTTLNEHYEIRICIDCAMLIANGESNPEWTEAEEEAHLAAMDKCWPGDKYHLTVGDAVEDFSWSSCDCCGSNLGGARLEAHAFTLSD